MDTLQPIADCHVHVFDPARFPYRADTWYRPVGQETGTAADLGRVLDAHGVRHALIARRAIEWVTPQHLFSFGA